MRLALALLVPSIVLTLGVPGSMDWDGRLLFCIAAILALIQDLKEIIK